jgi:SulP family sulfate permease
MRRRLRFDRLELAGSLGDLGTLLPLAIGMIVINGLEPTGLFVVIGLFYILAGLYFGVPTPVQPMKVISAYAIAAGLSASQITGAGLLMGLLLLVIGGTGIITFVGRYIPKSTVRGVQLATGTLLMSQGVRLMVGSTQFQLLHHAVEPYMTVQNVGPIPIGIIIGIGGGILTLFLLDNKRVPAGLFIVLAGLGLGLFWGTHKGFETMRIGINLPEMLPFGLPSSTDFTYVLLALVLPQLPMTIGNAVIANADLSQEYFGDESQRVTGRALCISMGLVNLVSSLFGGMPLCHGAGGLAAHYRFGARTAGSNVIIGLLFVLLALLLGSHIVAIVYLLPMSVLGVLLVFAGGQLALTIIDLMNRKDLFVVLIMLGITLATNLAAGFAAGIILAYLLQSEKLSV